MTWVLAGLWRCLLLADSIAVLVFAIVFISPVLRRGDAGLCFGSPVQILCSLCSSSNSLKQICSGRAQPGRCTRAKPALEQQSRASPRFCLGASLSGMALWPVFSALIAAKTHTFQLLLVAGASQTLPCRSDRLRAGCCTIPRAGGVLRLSPNKAKRRVMPAARRRSVSPPRPSGHTKVSAHSSSGVENPDGAPEVGSCSSRR